eukprot:CAMPEP_0168738710 /NCGR_PEP_ID=MMETSP0724-20121128/11077_1 /TAXON_ID=265536 /ORGANISM="Amphiprora sp., Strain CCMP467" /LENGTH=47 /DNA_ID= /DNA_START= /DNA_END= /DNA_ORIENTATION=
MATTASGTAMKQTTSTTSIIGNAIHKEPSKQWQDKLDQDVLVLHSGL